MPEIDRNPYNFVEFDPAGPIQANRIPREKSGEKLSGRIELTITAQSPLFIPKGEKEDPSFFTCTDIAHEERYAIPGSSVKGPVRAIFEILTLSRAGVTSSALGKPLMYTRRASHQFEILKIPTSSHIGRIRKRNGTDEDTYDFPLDIWNSYESFHNGEIPALHIGNYIWGICSEGELSCFGDTEIFLWPANCSARELMGLDGGYASRGPAEQAYATVDLAEAVFGFAGNHDVRAGTGPLKGRVEFSTFFGQRTTEAGLFEQALTLKPLTSPNGAKAKCRTLYYREIDSQARPVPGTSPESLGTILRGRKLYWHQAHKENGRETISPTQLAQGNEKFEAALVRVIPMKAGVAFSGHVDFHELNKLELGALLASLSPSLLFASNGDEYGLKLGKAKPRGLGSVSMKIDALIVRASYRDLYADLASISQDKTLDEREQSDLVDIYKNNILNLKKNDPEIKEYKDIPFVKDLEKLLRLPNGESVRQYPDSFPPFWSNPGIDDPDGWPTKGCPEPMDLARNLEP